MKAVRAAALLCLVAPAVAAAQSSAPAEAAAPLPSVAVPAEVERVMRDYERAWGARDAAGLAALFTDDGMVLGNGQPPVRGRAAVQRAYTGAGGPLALRPLAFAADDTVGYLVGGFAVRAGEPDVGKFVLLLRRAPGGPWRIAADMDNLNAMPRRAPAAAPSPSSTATPAPAP
jgi:ketosteroid isomerase-like protein